MQQIIVDLIAVAALLFLARMAYKNFFAARRSSDAACPGCGNCEVAKKSARDSSPAAPK